MKITIPQKTIPKQVNKGEIFGDIWGSWNLDLASNAGKIRVSPRMIVHSNSVGASGAGLVKPSAFVRSLSDTYQGAAMDSYFALCSQAVYKLHVAGLSSSYFEVDTITGSPTTDLSNLYSDMVTFNGELVVSAKTNLYGLNAGVWTSGWKSITLTGSTPHPMCAGFNKELLIGNGKNIVSVDASSNVNMTRLVLSEEYEVQWIRSSNTAYWIGARHKYGGEGKVFMWGGASDYVDRDYGIQSDITFAGVIKDNIPYTVNGNGQLLAFNGGAMVEIDRFPVAGSKGNKLDDNYGYVSTLKYPMNIHRNGMTVVDNAVNILVSAGLNNTNYTFLENMLGGIWEYTPETGLYHKNSLSKNTDNTNINDYGTPLIVRAGALEFVGSGGSTNPGLPVNINRDKNILAGADLYIADQNTGTQIGVINYLSGDAKNKMGYFITPKIYTNDIEEMWQAIHVLYKQLTTSGHFVHIKYRTSVNYRGSFDQPATWTSTTGFTCNATEFLAGVSAGDEIEILSGEGSGLSATITNLSSSAATIDQTLTGASGTFAFRVSNWTKLDTITDLISQNKSISIGTNTNWIQFKILMYGAGDSPEIEKLIIKSENHLKS